MRYSLSILSIVLLIVGVLIISGCEKDGDTSKSITNQPTDTGTQDPTDIGTEAKITCCAYTEPNTGTDAFGSPVTEEECREFDKEQERKNTNVRVYILRHPSLRCEDIGK